MSSQNATVEQAEGALTEGKWDQAIEQLESVRESQPECLEIYPRLVKAMSVRGRYLTVLALYLDWAECSLRNSELELAEQAVDAALSLQPNSVKAKRLSAEVARHQGDQNLLIERLLELSFLIIESGSDEDPIELIREAIEIRPDDVGLKMQLAESYISMGQIEAAKKQYRNCIDELRSKARSRETLEPLRKLRMLQSDNLETLLELGETSLELDLVDEAEEQFRAVLRMDIENREALLALAEVCRRKGRFRNGLLALNRILQNDPDSPLAHHRMGDLHLASGEQDKATKAYHQAAEFYLELGDREGAGAAFQAVLAYDPDNTVSVSGMTSLGLEPLPKPEPEPVSPQMEAPEETGEPATPLEEDEVVKEPEPVETEERPTRETIKRRPALIKKEQFRQEKRTAREGLIRKESGPKRALTKTGLRPRSAGDSKKPFFPRERKSPEQPVIEIEVEPAEPEQEPDFASEPEPQTPLLLVEEPAKAETAPVAEVQEKNDIPAFEDVFQTDERSTIAEEPPTPLPADPQVDEPVSKKDPDSIFHFEDIFEEWDAELDHEPFGGSEEPEVHTEEPTAEVLFDWGEATEAETVGEIAADVLPKETERASEPQPEPGPLFPEESHLPEETDFPEEPSESEVSIFEDFFPPEDEEIEEPTETKAQTLELERPQAGPLDEETPEEIDYASLREAEIAKVEVSLEEEAEQEELAEMLERTLPQPSSEPEEAAETPLPEAETLNLPEPEVLVEKGILPQPEAPEMVMEPEPVGDVGSRLETLRHQLTVTPTDEEKALAAADLSLRYGLLPEALNQYRGLQRLNPSSTEICARIIKTALWMDDYDTVTSQLWKAANLEFHQGDLERCQERLGDLLSLDPDHREGRQLLVELFLAQGESKLAAWHLSKMVEHWLAEGNLEHACSSLEKLAQISGGFSVRERLAGLYEKLDRLSDALSTYRDIQADKEELSLSESLRVAEKIVSLPGSSPGDRERLINLYLRSERPQEAAEHRFQLALQHKKNDEPAKAIQALRELLVQQPENLSAQLLLVRTQLESGCTEEAELHAESLAERFLQERTYKQAVELFETWVAICPGKAKARERLAQFHQLSGDPPAAKEEWLMANRCHQANEEHSLAARCLERALELDPGQDEWRYELAKIKAYQLDDMESALNDLRRLFEEKQQVTQAGELYLELLVKAGRMQELGSALKQLSELSEGQSLKARILRLVTQELESNPEDLNLRFGWGELCYSLEDLDPAIEQFQKLRRHSEYRAASYRLLGLCFARKKGLNMTELALSQFRKGLDDPQITKKEKLAILYDMSQLLRTKNRTEEAVACLEQCRELDPYYRDVSTQLER